MSINFTWLTVSMFTWNHVVVVVLYKNYYYIRLSEFSKSDEFGAITSLCRQDS